MSDDTIHDLTWLRISGRLYRPPDDPTRVEAFIPPAGRENHAANLALLPDGDLLCVWFAGSREGQADVRIACSRLPAGGACWSEPQWVSEDMNRSEQNPILFPTPDGPLWLLYTAQATRQGTRDEWERRREAGEVTGSYCMQWTAEVRRRVSTDGGRTWGPVETLFDRPGSFCRQPPLVLSNSEWLLPIYYSLETREGSHGQDYSVMLLSADRGATWSEHPVPDSRGRVQASVVETAPGELVAFFRSRAADRIYLSRSEDHGRTWTPPAPTELPNNNSSIQALRLHNGHLALAFNRFSANDDPTVALWPRRRYPVTLALSEDDGRTWPYMRHVDTSDDYAGPANAHLNRRCSYPSIVEGPSGTLHVVYSYRGRQCIKYVHVSEAWVRGTEEGEASVR
jgi:predicted neuraminidase